MTAMSVGWVCSVWSVIKQGLPQLLLIMGLLAQNIKYG